MKTNLVKIKVNKILNVFFILRHKTRATALNLQIIRVNIPTNVNDESRFTTASKNNNEQTSPHNFHNFKQFQEW